MMKIEFLSLALGTMLAACTATAATGNYKITADIPNQSQEGTMAYLVNYDTGEKTDSTIVENGQAIFTGTVEQPYAATVTTDGRKIIVEPGEIHSAISPKTGPITTGTKYNDLNQAFLQRVMQFREQLQGLPRDSTYQAAEQKIFEAYEAFVDSIFAANADNIIGYTLFLGKAPGMSLAELNKVLNEHPSLKSYQRVQKQLTAALNKEATSPGKKYIDFTIDNDSTKQSLSDYVGKGKPVIVDFWASWCGPCIRETAVLKELLTQYGPQGLEVLGVAVWDDPENTLQAIKKHALPWPQILNAQKIPTDIYGIAAIPTILVIGPDGTILSRDKQDDDLRADVKAVMEGTLTPASFAAPAEAADSVSHGH